MTSTSRRPLASRPLPIQLPAMLSPLKTMTARTVSAKRARSPEPAGDASTKRARSMTAAGSTTVLLASPNNTATRDEDRREKERRRAEREMQKEEFRVKYTKAFPSWTFYFDLDIVDPESAALRENLEAKVSHLGATVDDFFSNEITHLITNRTPRAPAADPSEETLSNKENMPKTRGRPNSLLKSPIKLRGRVGADDASGTYDIVEKAASFGKKIWTTTKLDSVLQRCLPTDSYASPRPIATTAASAAAITRQRSLTRLLESERLHGTTERDPTQRRHDWRYFSRSSYFLLVEDMRQELATIAATEYPISKSRDGTEKGTWPVLHCHPHARGPFVEFDEREKRRYEKSLRGEAEKEKEREERQARMRQREREQNRRAQAQMHAKRGGDLRRSVSMNNLHRRVSQPEAGLEFVDLDDCGDNQDSANASGYLASTGTGGGYMAASGNSVGITSTTGTTSNTSNAHRSLQLPAALRDKLSQQVATTRKVSIAAGSKEQGRKTGAMGPPAGLPERPPAMLRKSRSTNTLRLSKREEGTKPGYCESCRVKFDDFKNHVKSRKHRKFAANDAHFSALDEVLSRVQRRTIEEVEAERVEWEAMRCGANLGYDRCEDYLEQSPLGDADETMRPADDNDDDDDFDVNWAGAIEAP
ncbi:hypothetical protein PLICRDRAFT_88953 [Plicaturopsis crispa FD-325 SS-3]|nr:hypothetical protein PLICRDRAFT_88953 [Plicaturopsis crispa FD-325 SS-3]